MVKRSDRIEKIRIGLHKLYLPRFDQLCKILDPAWMPVSGYRSIMEQDALYTQGRDPVTLKTLYPSKIVTEARGGFSAHNWGLATDFALFDQNGKPIWSHDKWPEYTLGCKRAALEWGGYFANFPDKPHNQMPLMCAYKTIGDELLAKGKDAAQALLERSILI